MNATATAEREREILARNFTEGIVKNLDGRSMTLDGGRGFGGWPEDAQLPIVGDVVRWYTIGLSRVRGGDINGRPVWFRSDAEMAAQHEQMVAKHHERREAEFVANEARLNEQVDALPEPLKARIESLRVAGGRNWRVESESYEVFVCTQAAAIAEHFAGDEPNLMRWVKLPFDQQQAELPALDGGHSGNTFGAAVRFATMMIRGEHGTVAVFPAAMAPIQGDPRYPQRDDS